MSEFPWKFQLTRLLREKGFTVSNPAHTKYCKEFYAWSKIFKLKEISFFDKPTVLEFFASTWEFFHSLPLNDFGIQ